VQILIPTGFTSCGDEWNIGVARTGYMKKNGRYCGQIRCYNERSTRCSTDRPHPRLQHQTKAYPAWATRTLFAVSDRMIRTWDAKTGAAVGDPLHGHTDSVYSVAYAPNARHIVSGSVDRTIRIWNAETGAAVGKPLEGHTDYVWSVAFSPDGRHIISGSGDRTIRIWDAETGAAVGKHLYGHGQSPHHVFSLAYSPDGQNIISGPSDSTIRIWGAEAGVVIGNPLEGHTGYVRSVVYSPDGQHIVSGSDDGTIRIWDAETGVAIGKPRTGHAGPVGSIACSPDGRHIVSGSYDNTIHVWDLSPHIPTHYSSTCNPMHTDFCVQPDPDGWVRDSEHGLLYWVPPDCRSGLHSSALLTIPPTAHTRTVSLDFVDFVFGVSWIQIFSST